MDLILCSWALMEKSFNSIFYFIYKMYVEYENTKVKVEYVDSALDKGQRTM